MTDFEIWEALFLAGEMPVTHFQELLSDNLDFSIWYEERAAARHAND